MKSTAITHPINSIDIMAEEDRDALFTWDHNPTQLLSKIFDFQRHSEEGWEPVRWVDGDYVSVESTNVEDYRGVFYVRHVATGKVYRSNQRSRIFNWGWDHQADAEAYAADMARIQEEPQEDAGQEEAQEDAGQAGQISLPKNSGVVVCYGGGVDSTAMLIALRDAGIRPDMITFADTGAEKPETYETVRRMDEWLVAQGFPTVTWCKKKTLDSTPYNSLGGNCSDNETLPSLAFGMKSCSIKWKQGPQDNILKGVSKGPNKCEPHPLWLQAKASGTKLVKLIGYDNSKADIRRSSRVKKEDADFLYNYPLQDLGWERQDCIARIVAEGLPVPIKSACYFCPASQKWELWWLAGAHPELFLDALAIEHRAMVGKHSRWGSDECTYDKDWEDLVNQPADQWPTTKITVGLGRAFAWNHWARENGIVDRATGAFIGDREHCLAMAEQLKGEGGNASDTRTCGQVPAQDLDQDPDLISLRLVA